MLKPVNNYFNFLTCESKFKKSNMRKLIILIILMFAIFSCKNNNKVIDREAELKILNTFMDNWHHSAAIADENMFFGSMDSNAVYLGTDPGERWLKSEFMSWGMKYFQRDTAWAFIPYNRIWEFTDDYQYAWFDELLETHMGTCRGSGILKRFGDGWKIKQYNLTLTLPNDRMKDYRKMINLPIK